LQNYPQILDISEEEEEKKKKKKIDAQEIAGTKLRSSEFVI
jgi:hypothetical protein